MFGRHRALDGDAVAAAQRRLAALAAQHRAGEPPEPMPAPTPAPVGEVDEGSPVDSAPAARHRGRRAELGSWGVDAQHVAVAAVLVVALVVAVAWWALRSVPRSDPVRLSSERVLPSGPSPSSTPSSATSPTTPAPGAAGVVGPAGAGGSARLVIDVAGKVRDPGIVELPAGSRVIDAIAAAGGARPGVSLTSLNLARLLVDGEQIVVGVEVPAMGVGPATVGGSGGGATYGSPAQVNLNTATLEQLDTLPGVGPVTAQAILQWRADNGPFARVDDLLDVSGIGPATMADLRPYVYV